MCFNFNDFKASESFDCNFETSTCGWTSDLTANFEWVRIQGKNSLSIWQPTVDYTTSSSGIFSF